MDPPAHVASARAALVTRAAGAVVRAGQVEAPRRGEGGGLALHDGIRRCVVGQNGGEEREEVWVGREGLGGYGERGGGSDGEVGGWWDGGEEGEEVSGRVEGVFVDELEMC